MTTVAVDTSVNIPPAVRAAAARAQELYDQAYKAEAEAPKADEAPAAETPVEPVAEQTAPAPQTEVTHTSNTEPELPKTESKVDEQSWEHRYKSMKGRYDRAMEQVTALSEQISSLQQAMASLQASTPVRETSQIEVDDDTTITEEEERDYGSDLLSVVGRKALQEVKPLLRKYEEEIASLKGQLKGTANYVTQDARARMMTNLTSSVPNWEEININDDFKSWLKLPDTYSGVIRHELLKAAYERNDAPRVIAFFKGFLSEEAAVAPAGLGRDVSQAQAGKIPLEEFAAPGRAKTAAASAPAEKPSFTSAQIASFYRRVAAGEYRGKDADRQKLEAEIFAAQRDGRIVQ